MTIIMPSASSPATMIKSETGDLFVDVPGIQPQFQIVTDAHLPLTIDPPIQHIMNMHDIFL